MDDTQLRAALGYRKFAGEVPRVLCFETGYHVEADVRDAAADLGWPLASLPVRARGQGEGRFVAALLEALVVHRPDFVVTLNQFGFDEAGVLAGLLARYEVPVASWFVDHPRLIFPAAERQATPLMQLFSLERTSLAWLRARGFEAPAHLPTASNARRYHPARIERERARALGAPLVFVGHSWWSKARTEPTPEDQARAAALGWALPLTRAFVGEGFGARVDAIDAPSDAARMWAARVRVAESSLQRRAALARALGPDGLVVHGDDGWRALVPDVALRREVDPATELPALFAGSRVNVNVTSDQLATAVNQRVWDVPAAGGFLLTDAQEDALAAFGEGEALAVYRSLDEARDQARFYAAHDAARLAVVQRARRVVELGHRYTHRLRAMADVMRARFG